jgi:hypothetical protein
LSRIISTIPSNHIEKRRTKKFEFFFMMHAGHRKSCDVG